MSHVDGSELTLGELNEMISLAESVPIRVESESNKPPEVASGASDVPRASTTLLGRRARGDSNASCITAKSARTEVSSVIAEGSGRENKPEVSRTLVANQLVSEGSCLLICPANKRHLLKYLKAELKVKHTFTYYFGGDEGYDVIRQEVWDKLLSLIQTVKFRNCIIWFPSETFSPVYRSAKYPLGNLEAKRRIPAVKFENLACVRGIKAIRECARAFNTKWLLIGQNLTQDLTVWEHPVVNSFNTLFSGTKFNISVMDEGHSISGFHGRCVRSVEASRDELPQMMKPKAKLNSESNLMQEDPREEEDRNCIGGLRSAHKSVAKLPGHLVWGPQISQLVEDWMEENKAFCDNVLVSLSDPKHKHPPEVKDVEGLKVQIYEFLVTALKLRGIDYRPRGIPDDCTLSADLLSAWSLLTDDPGALTSHWFWDGAPSGMEVHHELGNLFPRSRGEPDQEEPEGLMTNFDSFVNYSGIEETDDAFDELMAFSRRRPPFLEVKRTVKQV